MPCYQINYMTVEFKAKNKEWIEKACKALDWAYQDYGTYVQAGNISINMKEGTAKIERYQQDSLNKLKQTYSLCAVQELAKKKKWAVKVKAANKLELRRY